jgi:phage gp36-like protein
MAQYATTTDLGRLGLPAAALVNVPTAVQDAHLTAQGDRIDTYLRSQHTLPLGAPFPREVVECNAVMAGYAILQNYRGYDPSAVDDGFRLRYEDCLDWLKDLASGKASLSQDADDTPLVNEGRPRVQTGGAGTVWSTTDTNDTRGW